MRPARDQCLGLAWLPQNMSEKYYSAWVYGNESMRVIRRHRQEYAQKVRRAPPQQLPASAAAASRGLLLLLLLSAIGYRHPPPSRARKRPRPKHSLAVTGKAPGLDFSTVDMSQCRPFTGVLRSAQICVFV